MSFGLVTIQGRFLGKVQMLVTNTGGSNYLHWQFSHLTELGYVVCCFVST